MKILIVDDDAGIRAMASDVFKNLLPDESNVWTADSLGEALSVLDKQRIDIVLLDLQMLPSSPIDNTIRHIPKIASRADVIIMTGYDTPEIRKIVREQGAVGFIAKEPHVFSTRFQLAVELVKTMKEWGGTSKTKMWRNLYVLEELVNLKVQNNA